MNLYVIFPAFWPQNTTQNLSKNSLKVSTFNLFYGNRNFQEVRSFIRKENCDLILLQEVTAVWEKELKILKDIYPYSKGVPREDSFGILILSKRPFINSSLEYFGLEHKVPAVVVDVKFQNETVRVTNIHTLPPVNASYSQKRNKQLQKIAEYAKSFDGHQIIAGDFNISPWSPYFTDFLYRSRLQNSGVGFGIQNTWPRSPFWLRTQIDHCFVSSKIFVNKREIGSSSLGSDHFPIVLELFFLESS